MIIYKYKLDKFFPETQTFELETYTDIRHVAFQDGEIMMWVEHPNYSPTKEKRTFTILGTGWDMSEINSSESIYIGTVHKDGYVWHIYELLLEEEV